jgi:hypothetical protein
MHSQFPPACVCEPFIYSHDRSVYSAAGNMGDRAWDEAGQFPEKEYINEIFAAVQYCSLASEKRFHCTTVSCRSQLGELPDICHTVISNCLSRSEGIV